MIDWTQLQTAEDREAERLAQAAERVRKERNRLLAETDFMALIDVTMPQAIADYRQALRDVPQQPGFPDDVVWPEVPNVR